MAVREAEWTYSNDGRIAFVFLAFAIVLLALGLLAVTAFGSDAANGGVALLAIAMFLLVFSVLVFVPRLARRGAASFSFYSRRTLDEAVKAVIVATPANTMPATAKPPIVPNNFDFKVLYDILVPPYSPCGVETDVHVVSFLFLGPGWAQLLENSVGGADASRRLGLAVSGLQALP